MSDRKNADKISLKIEIQADKSILISSSMLDGAQKILMQEDAFIAMLNDYIDQQQINPNLLS